MPPPIPASEAQANDSTTTIGNNPEGFQFGDIFEWLGLGQYGADSNFNFNFDRMGKGLNALGSLAGLYLGFQGLGDRKRQTQFMIDSGTNFANNKLAGLFSQAKDQNNMRLFNAQANNMDPSGVNLIDMSQFKPLGNNGPVYTGPTNPNFLPNYGSNQPGGVRI